MVEERVFGILATVQLLIFGGSRGGGGGGLTMYVRSTFGEG